MIARTFFEEGYYIILVVHFSENQLYGDCPYISFRMYLPPGYPHFVSLQGNRRERAVNTPQVMQRTVEAVKMDYAFYLSRFCESSNFYF